jgi:hypothetical protein
MRAEKGRVPHWLFSRISHYAAFASVALPPIGPSNSSKRQEPLAGPARRLATHMMGQFFAQPIRGDKPALRLMVDNAGAGRIGASILARGDQVIYCSVCNR